MTEIKKPWCVYSGVSFIPMGIGAIESETETSACVKYTDRQIPMAWEKRYLACFSFPEEAIELFSKKTGQSIGRTSEEFLINFPSQKLRERWME